MNRSYHPFEDLEQVWTEEADKSAACCLKQTTVLLPIPKGLIHWKQFDAE